MRAYKDIVGGLAAMVAGAFLAIHSMLTLRIGTLSQAGPGMLPVALGVILTVLGLMIFVPALFRSGPRIEFDMRSAFYIIAAMVAFALLLKPFGLIPAVMASVLLSAQAENGLSLVGRLALAVALALGTTLLFVVGLSIRLAPLNWPW